MSGMLSPTFFINVFYLVLFCIHVCVDDVIKNKTTKNKNKLTTGHIFAGWFSSTVKNIVPGEGRFFVKISNA